MGVAVTVAERLTRVVELLEPIQVQGLADEASEQAGFLNQLELHLTEVPEVQSVTMGQRLFFPFLKTSRERQSGAGVGAASSARPSPAPPSVRFLSWFQGCRLHIQTSLLCSRQGRRAGGVCPLGPFS